MFYRISSIVYNTQIHKYFNETPEVLVQVYQKHILFRSFVQWHYLTKKSYVVRIYAIY